MQRKYSESVIYGGGLDVVTPPLQVEPGKLLQAKNFEADVSRGYRLMEGYERFDGQPSPVKSSFFALALVSPVGFIAGEVATGSTSGATGTILSVGVAGIYLVAVTGTFQSGEVITSPSASDTAASDSFANITISDDEDVRDVRFAKEEYFKQFIQKVPGIGPVRGIHRVGATTLAFRDFDGVEGRVYRASATGWVQLGDVHIVFFGNRTNKIAVGIQVEDSVGNTADAVRVFYTTVAEDEGYLVLNNYTSGFAAGTSIKQGTTTLAMITVSAEAYLIKPGGRYEFITHSFDGAPDEFNMYGCDGVNAGFEYHPPLDAYSPIFTDQLDIDNDNPSFVSAYKGHLFFGYARGILRNSEPNDITLWDAAAGALEIAVGAEVTGMDAVPQGLVVGTRRSTYVLTGDTIENFALALASAKTGAVKHTMRHIGTTYMLDDRGIVELSRVQAFGNFENATVSRNIQPILTELKGTITASAVSYTKNVYRLIAADGRGVSMTFEVDGKLSFSQFSLDTQVFCADTYEDETGEERIVFGGDEGYVYEWDTGRSYDGVEREAWIQPTYHFLGSQTLRKRFYRMYVDYSVSGQANVQTYAEFSLGSPDARPSLTIDSPIKGLDSAWDVANWDQAVFDARLSSDAHVDLQGTGESIGIIFYHKSGKDDIFTVRDITYHYKTRRLQRGSR